MPPYAPEYTRPETVMAMNPGRSCRTTAIATPATASTREIPLPSGPFMMGDSADTATNTFLAKDAEGWREPEKRPIVLLSINRAIEDIIHDVLEDQASATPFARWCTWALIKHYRLWIHIPAYRKGALNEQWDDFMWEAGKLLVWARKAAEECPSVQEQDGLRDTERELMTALMKRSKKLRLTACKLNLALVLGVEEEYGEKLRGMSLWDTVRVREVIGEGRSELREKWVEVEARDEEEREMFRSMVSGREGLLERFEESERRVATHEAAYLADVTNRPPRIQERPRAVVARRGENVPPVRVDRRLRVAGSGR